MIDSPAPTNPPVDVPGATRRVFLSVTAFLGAIAIAWVCLRGYEQLGGGASGLVGLAVLLAPVGVLAAAMITPRIRVAVRAFRAVIVVGILFPYLLVSCELPEITRRERFDSAAWKRFDPRAKTNAPDWRTPIRIRQVDHLIVSGILDGKSRDEVLALLGPDDSVNGTGYGAGYFREWESVYWLGPERGFMSIDSEWLVLRYDHGKIVSAYQLIRD